MSWECLVSTGTRLSAINRDSTRAPTCCVSERQESRSISLTGMPRIGAGYARLEWTKVKRILDAVGAETEVVLVVYEKPP